jgi:putative flippase GtrA
MIARALHSKQFLVFIIGGVLSAVVDVGSMVMLLRFGSIVFIATTAGFLFGLVVNYLFHLRLTFSANNSASTAARYLVIVSVNYLITLAFVFLGVHVCGGATLGKVASIPVIAVIGFLLSKYWAFR